MSENRINDNNIRNDSIDNIQNNFFVKKLNKKTVKIKWPGILYFQKFQVEIEGNFFCSETQIPAYIDEFTNEYFIPNGYQNLYSHFQYLKEKLFGTTVNFFIKKTKLEKRDAFGRISSCINEIVMNIQSIMNNFDEMPRENFEELIEEWKFELKDWNNAGIFSGSWDNFNTFVNKRSLIIDEDLFLISNESEDLNNILFHPFVSNYSISEFQDSYSLKCNSSGNKH